MSRLKNLYVIRLDKAVLEEPKFRKENPGYRPWKPCIYVGVTSLDPAERFRQHKTGYKAGRGYVTKYGKYLMWRKYKRLNPVPSVETVTGRGNWPNRYDEKGTGCGSANWSRWPSGVRASRSCTRPSVWPNSWRRRAGRN